MGNTRNSGLDMKAAYLFKLTRLTTIATLGLLAGDVSSAQSPSGPITAAPTQPGPTPTANPAPLSAPRTTILGAWKFNPDDSDDPRKRREDYRNPKMRITTRLPRSLTGRDWSAMKRILAETR